jgi:prolipoprotein diacylglyceryltransferase
VYGIERFIFEFFRGDPGRGEVLGLISGTQLIALGLVLTGFVIYLKHTPLRAFTPGAGRAAKTPSSSASRA